MADRSSVRLEICPKCGERGYDITLGRCFYCGYSTWSTVLSFKTARKPLLAAFILIVILLLLGLWLGAWKLPTA